MSKISLTPDASGTGTFTIASPGTNTDRTLTLPDAAGTLVAKAGTYISPSELGSGTPSASNFLRGDGSWQVISTTPTTDQVLTATAGAAAGAVGTYALARNDSGSTVSFGNTVAGSNLTPAGGAFASGSGLNLWTAGGSGFAGTWRNMSRSAGGVDAEFSLFLRIS